MPESVNISLFRGTFVLMVVFKKKKKHNEKFPGNNSVKDLTEISNPGLQGFRRNNYDQA